MRMGLSSLCIFRYREFNEKPCCDVLNTSDQEYPSALAGRCPQSFSLYFKLNK